MVLAFSKDNQNKSHDVEANFPILVIQKFHQLQWAMSHGTSTLVFHYYRHTLPLGHNFL